MYEKIDSWTLKVYSDVIYSSFNVSLCYYLGPLNFWTRKIKFILVNCSNLVFIKIKLKFDKYIEYYLIITFKLMSILFTKLMSNSLRKIVKILDYGA